MITLEQNAKVDHLTLGAGPDQVSALKVGAGASVQDVELDSVPVENKKADSSFITVNLGAGSSLSHIAPTYYFGRYIDHFFTQTVLHPALDIQPGERIDFGGKSICQDSRLHYFGVQEEHVRVGSAQDLQALCH